MNIDMDLCLSAAKILSCPFAAAGFLYCTKKGLPIFWQSFF